MAENRPCCPWASYPRACLSAALYLLGAPAGVGLPHVGGGLDGGDELEDGVADADEADDGAGDYAQDVAVQQDGADEDVEGAAADEAEEEGGVARDLGRDLELEEAGGCWRREKNVSLVMGEKDIRGGRRFGRLRGARSSRSMLTEAEDHDIASDDDGLAVVR